MLYQISNGTMFFGANDIFENIDFQVIENEKIAIVGKNGCGKSTLLKIIMGDLELSSGEIHRAGNMTVGYLKQNIYLESDRSVYDEFLSVFENLIKMEDELNALAEEMKTKHDDKYLVDRYAKMQTQFEYLGGYNYHNEIKSIFSGFGFKIEDLYRPLSSFSGGEKTKIGFAKLLLSKPDLLLLDEPTNHLDLRTIEWLESYLAKYNKAVILVSHDRAFIDKIVSVVYEIEHGSMTKYSGNYTSFQKQKKENLLRQEALYRNQQKDIKRLEELIEKYRYKATKAKMAQNKIKYLERMDRIEDPKKADTKAFKAKFKCKVKGGKNVLALDHFAFGYGDKKLGEVSLEILRQDRICIMGDNGTGKSTLLKTIVGELKELGGYKLFGHQIEIGYFDQTLAAVNSNKTVLEELWDEYPDLDNYQIRSILAAFLFSSEEVFKEVNVLSGGEKVRLALAKLMLQGANFLILDEPTNHLDIVSKEALENCLKDYDGTILFVSHDRYFIKNIANSCLVLENGESTYYPDGYKDYIDQTKKVVPDEKGEVKEVKVVKNVKPKAKYNLKKIEARLAELEELLETKRELRYDPEYYHDHAKMQALDEEIDDIHNQIHHTEDEWELAMLEKEELGL